MKEAAQNRFAAAFEKILIKIIEIIKKFYPIFNQFFEKVNQNYPSNGWFELGL